MSEDEPSNPRLRWLLGTAGVLTVAVLVVWWPGCREYPPVSSREALVLMKLLYTACNTRDVARLTKAEQGVEALTRAGKMTPGERAGFDHILGLAKSGDWAAAERAALKFAEDQVGQGRANAGAHAHP